MGNSQTTDCSSVCGLNFLTTKDLGCTSLQTVKPVKSIKTKRTSRVKQYQASQNDLDLPSHCEKKILSAEEVAAKCIQIKRSNTFDVNLRDTKDKGDVNENDFRIMQILADGRYGKVFMAKKDTGKEVYAMKIISKKRISHTNPAENILIEKELLEKANHAFIPKLLYSFENERNIFLVLEYIEGGELHKILHKLTRFSEEITRFYSAEVLIALEYLHERMKVTYNDLRPENILLDDEGHIRLTDFDFTRKLESGSSLPTSRNNLDTSLAESLEEAIPEKITDYWQFGCFIYELLTGKKPTPITKEMKDPESNFESELEWPPYISRNARDLITRLLNLKNEERLEYNIINEIKNHSFFANINWAKIGQKTVYPPLNPLQFKDYPKEEEEFEDDLESESEDCNRYSFVFSCTTEFTKDSSQIEDNLLHPSNLETTPGRDYKELQRRLIQ